MCYLAKFRWRNSSFCCSKRESSNAKHCETETGFSEWKFENFECIIKVTDKCRCDSTKWPPEGTSAVRRNSITIEGHYRTIGLNCRRLRQIVCLRNRRESSFVFFSERVARKNIAEQYRNYKLISRLFAEFRLFQRLIHVVRPRFDRTSPVAGRISFSSLFEAIHCPTVRRTDLPLQTLRFKHDVGGSERSKEINKQCRWFFVLSTRLLWTLSKAPLQSWRPQTEMTPKGKYQS